MTQGCAYPPAEENRSDTDLPRRCATQYRTKISTPAPKKKKSPVESVRSCLARENPSRSPDVKRPVPLVRSLALASMTALGLAVTARADDLTPRFEGYMKTCVEVNHFSGAVLVSKGGETLFGRGYGFANAEHQVPNTTRTKFRLGSITKQFTAMAILILQERGKLKVEDPVGRYLDDAPKAWAGVTIHHLLTHTGGVPSYTDDPGYRKKMMMPETVKSMIARFRDKPLDFQPGEKFHYSNSGYFLLGAIIEKVSGKSYEAFLKEAIFDPLGMRDTGYDHAATLLPSRASGYTRAQDGLVNAEYLDMTQPYAAGSLFSTVEDLALWDRSLDAGKLISKESYAKLYTPLKSNYAYGWVVTTANGRKEIHHGGGINGFVTENLRYPDQKVCVVVLCNVLPMNPGRVAHDLAAITFGESYELPRARKVAKVDLKVYDAYAGRYQLEPKVIATISRDGDRLLLEVTNQPRIEMFPESETVFFLKVVDATITFVKDDKGKVSHIVINRGGLDSKAMRIQGGSRGDDGAARK
jgi:CubicO group peptidase (beta-lactamase class C family)